MPYHFGFVLNFSLSLYKSININLTIKELTMETISINQLIISSDESLNGIQAVERIKSANDNKLSDDKKATAQGGVFVNATACSDSLLSLVKTKLTNVLADNVKVSDTMTLCKDNKRVWFSFASVSKDTNAEI